ncbi:MAG: hypothetical protein FJZ38_19060 [Candidatus Rokubacteria bacterium]|nr:hypothetical protein [Candidatus Rokubacteria bacterium]
MTVYEIRLIAVVGLLVIGALALVAALAVAHLQGIARHRKDGAVRGATALPAPADRRRAA